MNIFSRKYNQLINLKTPDRIILIFLFLYFTANLFFLDSFPFVHSDEAWLASLTRSMIMERNPAATEEFFRITERNPHAVKTLFHLLQMPFLLAEYSIASVRLLSVSASVLSLLFIYMFLRKNLPSPALSVLTVIVIALDTQFIYISRFARQEIIILFSASMQLFFMHDFLSRGRKKSLFKAGIVSGLSIFVHPNSFIIFTGIIFYLISYMLITEKRRYRAVEIIRTAGIYTGINFIFFTAVTAVSFCMDSNFLNNYLGFGQHHGTGDSLLIKIITLPRFFYKMFNRIQGTYYLPDIRFQFYFFAGAVLLFFIYLIIAIALKKERHPASAGTPADSTTPAQAGMFAPVSALFLPLGILSGIVLIGKYSPPSIVFIIVPMWIFSGLAAAEIFPRLHLLGKGRITAVLLLIFSAAASVNLVTTAKEIMIWKDYSYNSYGRIIKDNIGSGGGTGKVLANTNTAFFLDYGRLSAWRDLEELGEKEMSFKDYVRENNIETIIWSEEFDIIAAERPVWNSMYGNVYSYYNDAVSFLENNCIETGRVKMKGYPVRIVRKMLQKEYSLVFYSCSIIE